MRQQRLLYPYLQLSAADRSEIIGEHPSFEAKDNRDDGLYYIDKQHENSTKDGITWYEGVGDNERKMTENDTFKAGENYYVAIRLKPIQGYEFETDEEGDLLVRGAINGVQSIIGGNEERVFVGYAFDNQSGFISMDALVELIDLFSSFDTIEQSFLESYRLLCYNNKETVDELLDRIEDTLCSTDISKELSKIDKRLATISKKRQKLLDMRLDDMIDKEAYDEKYSAMVVEIEKLNGEKESLSNHNDRDKNIKKRLSDFRKVLSENDI